MGGASLPRRRPVYHEVLRPISRRSVLSLAALCFGCGAGAKGFVPPAEIEGGWKLISQGELPAADGAGEVREFGLRSAHAAEYAGPEGRRLSVRFYRMGSGSAAFELVQTWRPAEGKMALYQGAWFVVLESPALDHRALSALAEPLERHLAGR